MAMMQYNAAVVVDVDVVIVLARARLCKQTENLFLKKDTGGGFLSS